MAFRDVVLVDPHHETRRVPRFVEQRVPRERSEEARVRPDRPVARDPLSEPDGFCDVFSRRGHASRRAIERGEQRVERVRAVAVRELDAQRDVAHCAPGAPDGLRDQRQPCVRVSITGAHAAEQLAMNAADAPHAGTVADCQPVVVVHAPAEPTHEP